MAFKLRRGTDAERQNVTPAEGELIYTTDNKQIFVGDGTTAGGNPASGGGVVAGLSIPAGDPFYTEAQANPNDPFLDGDLHLRGKNIVGTGNIDIDGTITATGNINIGDGGDSITINGSIASNLTPEIGTGANGISSFSIGENPSTGISWNELWVNTVYAGSTLMGGNIEFDPVVSGIGVRGDIYDTAGGNRLWNATTSQADGELIFGNLTNATVTGAINTGTAATFNGGLTANTIECDTVYGNDGTTVIIDAGVTANVDGVAVFFGEFQGIHQGDTEGDVYTSDGNTVILDSTANTITTTAVDTGTMDATGNATVGGTLGVTGNQTNAGNLTVGGTFGVTGDLTASSNASVGGDATITGNTTVAGTLGVTGDTTVGNLSITGNLTATGTIAATTAETLATARTINGVSFNGSANITVEDNSKLPTSGLVPMLGDLTLAQDPTSPLHAVTKQYVDNNFHEISTNTTISATQTTYTGAILCSDFQEETTGGGLGISSVNGTIALNAGLAGSVSLQNLSSGPVVLSGVEIVGTSIATTDSSSLSVDNVTNFLSDVIVDGNITAARIDAEIIETSGAGIPRLESDTNIEVSIPTGRLNIIDGLLNFSLYTLADLGTDFTGTDGDIAFVEDSTLPQPHVYTSGNWMPMMSPTIGWELGNDGTNTAFTFTGPGFASATSDPALTLYRGHTYVFNNTANGASHPIAFQTTDPGSVGYDSGNLYTTGTSGNNEGVLVWTIPMDAPATLYYACEVHGGTMNGTITIA